MKSMFISIILLVAAVASSAEDKQSESKPGMDAWRDKLPAEVSKKLPKDMSELLAELGYDWRPKEQSGHSRRPIKVRGNDLNNFDEDETKDWVIHVRSQDFHGRPISGTLIYDLTEHAWICIAKLPGTFPIGWNHTNEGRNGICTSEPIPGEPLPNRREHYFRWDGKRYIPDRVEFARGG